MEKTLVVIHIASYQRTFYQAYVATSNREETGLKTSTLTA